ncbi:MAG: TonB family protein [Bacteroidetes bacterium]|nr:TonB family protein [Bacteroidota bacterium]
MMGDRKPSLTELVFEGRNKAYGAYYLRKKYFRNLLTSLLTGLLIIGLLVLLPFLYYVFEPPPLIDSDFMYEVEYYSMNMPPADEINKLANVYSKPIEESSQVPVVSDSIKPEEEKPIEEPPEQKQAVENAKEDSAAKAGGSGLGSGVGDDTGLASNIDVYPRFPGGDEARLWFLRKNIRYPDDALKNKIQGVVMVVFVVELDGSLSRVDVVNRLGGGCDEEAIRVTKTMPPWEPGKRNGQKVRVIVRMPIVFRIPGQPKLR